MATIDRYLEDIKNKTYGEDVRDAIHDGIQQCYTDATDVVKVSDTPPTSENTKIWIKPVNEDMSVPTWEEHEELAGEVDDLKAAITQMSDIPDLIRKTNQIDGAQYENDQTMSGITVHAVKYSGFQLTGSIAAGMAMYLTKSELAFEQGKNYTLFVESGIKNPGLQFGFRTTNPSGWVKTDDDKKACTPQKIEPFVFSPNTSYANCYLAIYNPGSSALTFDDSSTFYVYVFEGDYTAEDISKIKNAVKDSKEYTFDRLKFLSDKEKAIKTHGWQRLEYSDALVYKDQHFMNSEGEAVYVREHCILQIPDAGGISRIRFVLKTRNSNPLFIVKDANGTVKKVFARDFETAYINTNLFFVFPGGLAEGTTIYMNWYYKNDSDKADDYIDRIDIQYEKLISAIPAGKDLLNMQEAISDGTMYFGYSTGIQVISTTYCAGEFHVKAGDLIRTYMNCHIAYYDEYGNYIDGVVSSGSTYHQYTAPANTNGAMVSFKTVDINAFRIGVNEHFTIPINQAILKTGENTASEIDNESDIVNVNAIFEAPMSYTKDGSPTPLIVIFHGSGFGVSNDLWGSSSNGSITESTPFNKMINAFVKNGYAVCDINGYDNSIPNNTWGSQRSIIAYRKLIDYVLNTYNVEKNINIFAFSMGGLVALNFMNMNRDIVKCAAIASPVVSLYDQAYLGNANWNQQIKTSYGFAEETSWEDNLDLVQGYDPFERFINVNGKDYDISNYPFIRIWHGTNDSVSPLLSAHLVEAIRNAERDCTYRAVTNAGHEICYGGNDICNNEYVVYFNRFNRKGGQT